MILSDHGQSQGPRFADRYGEDLASVVARLAQSDVASSDDDVEGWGRTRALVDELSSPSGVTGRSMQSASAAMDKRDRNEPDAVARDRRRPDRRTGKGDGEEGRRRRATRPSTSSAPATSA